MIEEVLKYRAAAFWHSSTASCSLNCIGGAFGVNKEADAASWQILTQTSALNWPRSSITVVARKIY
jgi:hypothetical protein